MTRWADRGERSVPFCLCPTWSRDCWDHSWGLICQLSGGDWWSSLGSLTSYLRLTAAQLSNHAVAGLWPVRKSGKKRKKEQTNKKKKTHSLWTNQSPTSLDRRFCQNYQIKLNKDNKKKTENTTTLYQFLSLISLWVCLCVCVCVCVNSQCEKVNDRQNGCR